MTSLDELRRVIGQRLALRLVTLEDAAYIHGLRINPDYNSHLSKVVGTVADQQAWISAYKEREAALSELYYVITRLDGTPCGVVRLYDIGQDSFTWGSWILDHNKPAKAALESAMLSFGVGFEKLGLTRVIFDARLHNTHAIAFYRRFGATEAKRDDVNIYFEYSRDRYFQDRETYLDIIKGYSDA